MSRWTKSYGSRNPLCAPSTRAGPCSVSVDTVTADSATVRVLDAEGTFAPSPAADEYLPLIEALPDAELEQFYRDMVVIRAIDAQATNLQRQGQLALWPPSRGQEAAQVGSARAARAQDTLFPSYREHAVTRIRGVDPIDIIKVMRGTSNSGWDPTDPTQRQHSHLHARARFADAARHRPRHGPGLRRQVRHRRRRARRGRHGLLRRRRVQPGRRARGHGVRRELSGARGLLPAEQPVGDLGARFRRSPACRSCSAPPGTACRRSASTATTCSPATRYPPRPRRGARRRGSACDRGGHLPHGCAHDERRPDQVPRQRRGAVLGAARSDRPDARVPAKGGARRTLLRRRRDRGRGRRRGSAGPHARA